MPFKKLLPEEEEETVGYLMDKYDKYKRYMTKQYNMNKRQNSKMLGRDNNA